MEGGTRWLFLKREGLNSYWELRNTFFLEDLEEGLVPEQVSVQVLRTATLAPNPAYDGLIDDFRVSLTDATISFEFSDGTGRFYPRPFPGEDPYPGRAILSTPTTRSTAAPPMHRPKPR